MAQIDVTLPHHAYSVAVEPGCLARIGESLRRLNQHNRVALLADEKVYHLHGEVAEQSLIESGFSVISTPFPAREESKTLDIVRHLYDVLLEARIERGCPVLSLGGGVAGDIIGFVASTCLRGLPFVQCPTTLLSMVDASVGGKVGVNMPQGKNLVGSFYQPKGVFIDPLVLQTLPVRELRCGLAECVKHGMIRSKELFSWIEQNLDDIQSLEPEVLVELISRNVEIKASVVIKDEKEKNIRAHLNFGHTFAHAIEQTSGYGIIEHGEAVALGMIAATKLSIDAGRCKPRALDRLVLLLEKIGLPTKAQLAPTEHLFESMTRDKKVQGDQIRLVLPTEIGEVFIADDFNKESITGAWEIIRQ